MRCQFQEWLEKNSRRYYALRKKYHLRSTPPQNFVLSGQSWVEPSETNLLKQVFGKNFSGTTSFSLRFTNRETYYVGRVGHSFRHIVWIWPWKRKPMC